MEISTEMTKLMTNSVNGIQAEIKVKGRKLDTVKASSTLEQLFQMMAPNQRFSKDCTSHCSSYKAETHLERLQDISWVGHR